MGESEANVAKKTNWQLVEQAIARKRARYAEIKARDQAEQAEQEPCANCRALTSEWNEDLRRYLHDGCRGEYLFGE